MRAAGLSHEPTAAAYYATPEVRARILEYCGASDDSAPTAAFVATLSPTDAAPIQWEHARHWPLDRLDEVWRLGADMARSLWDTRHLILALDFDYENVDAPGAAFVHPADVFLKLEPVYRAAMAVCRRYGLPLRAIMTGRGYHVAGRVALDDPVVDALAAIAPATPPWFDGIDARRPEGVKAVMTARQARAAAGLGCVVEFLAHEIRRQADAHGVPVVFNGTTVGRTTVVGREAISIDFSYAGDPLDVRHIRTLFGTYQWHRLRPDIFGNTVADGVPAIAAIPRDGRPLLALLGARDLASAAHAAAHTRGGLTDVSTGLTHLLAAYQTSPLAAFHRAYAVDLEREALPADGPDLAALPHCVAVALEYPNDLLLKPEHLQHVVRALMSRGWTPAAIARLVEAAYRADHGWGDRWRTRMDPRTRAEFDVRVFAGMIVVGDDTLVDFNCVSAQEKGLCPRADCRYDLRLDRGRLRAWRA